jgi:hypothetical protein
VETTGQVKKAGNVAVDLEETMAEQEKVATNGDAGQSAKVGKVELAEKAIVPAAPAEAPQAEAGLAVRAHRADEIEIAESFTSAGLRPIAASHLDVFATMLNNRPIMASHLHVVEYALPGNRPVFASDLVVRDDLTLPGGRPIVASDPHLLESNWMIGGRPVASNEIDDSETLMGFID